ncbi:ImmA/IrrE family metallo-endopeptidase [Bifidobacterium sp. CP2]|uniref:ImmA/IrrE family metallo-endopeptidase n=1 Tax=Bifidobacterium sp. CP2 TaxID=2809025 RepID=UPI001BDC4C76|nr:ImmA/IrrE family metallo-endopeptidase [Bifidobacterium sp. CP2]MBT1182023.1 ImmA/IrrE family metallo-endopeptidase [Bifidobacterium sp. CP2]
MAKLSRKWVVRQADRMLAVAHERHPDTFLKDCLHDPMKDIPLHWSDEITITTSKASSEERNSTTGECVSGFCLPQHKTADGKAFIEVHTVFYPRDCFTILHELGHHLQNSDIDLFCALRALDDKADQKRAEEAACNMFASKALMPDSLIPELGTHRWDATAVDRLFHLVKASRAATAIRIAGLLPPGAWVTFIDQYDRPKLRAYSDGHTEYDGIEIMPAEQLVLDAFDDRRREPFRKCRPGEHRNEMTVCITDLDKPCIPSTPPEHCTRISVALSPMSKSGTCTFIMGGH